MHFDTEQFCKYVNKDREYKRWNEVVRDHLVQNRETIPHSRMIDYNSGALFEEANNSLKEYCIDSINRMLRKYCLNLNLELDLPPIEIRDMLAQRLCNYLGVKW